MFEFAAFGFVTLVWWTWPLIGVVVCLGTYIAYKLALWQDHRYEQRMGHDVQPCMRHMGTDSTGLEHWCWQLEGHESPHKNEFGAGPYDVEPDEVWGTNT